jgi:hypothetical protein
MGESPVATMAQPERGIIPVTVLLAAGESIVTRLPAWLTVNVWPPMVRVLLRELPVEFAATAYVTVPLPLLDALEVTVSQEALLAAVQLHSAGVVIVTEPGPPLALGEAIVGLSA